MLQAVLPNKKAQAAQHDQAPDGAQHHRVLPEARKAGEGPGVLPHQVESGIAESGHAVKDGVPQPPPPAEERDEASSQQDRTTALQQKGAHEGVAHHPHYPGHPIQIKCGGDGQPLGQADAPPQQQRDQADQ